MINSGIHYEAVRSIIIFPFLLNPTEDVKFRPFPEAPEQLLVGSIVVDKVDYCEVAERRRLPNDSLLRITRKLWGELLCDDDQMEVTKFSEWKRHSKTTNTKD